MAGVAVAMGNAVPAVSKWARFIAPSNAEDGAAVALETLLQLPSKTCGSSVNANSCASAPAA